MIAIPAVDVRGGQCVQLVGGAPDREVVRLPDPVRIARGWSDAGFQRLHVVDLDAAMARGNNARVVRELLDMEEFEVQVGGGVRDSDAIERLVDDGATRVIVGTRAVTDAWWLAEVAELWPQSIIVAADVRDRRVVTHGWERTTPRLVTDLIDELNDLPLAGVMVTAVHLEGQMQGTDLPLMEDVAEESVHPVIASGGIATMQDLRALEDRNVAAAVIGMALYTGALDARAVASEFGE